MRRKIIKIDEVKCDGCGQCIPNCPEGALQIVDGKARMVSEFSCDGLGACLGHCPRGAISIEEREAAAYDERQVMARIIAAGPETIAAHLRHLREHGEEALLAQAQAVLRGQGIAAPDGSAPAPSAGGGGCSCPGGQAQDLRPAGESGASAGGTGPLASELRQWPVQLALLSPQAGYFQQADLLLAADCVAFAYGDFHRNFLKGKILIVFCPKLDQVLEQYIEKLTAIFRSQQIRSVTVVRMEVPCCGGVRRILDQALSRSAVVVPVEEVVVSLQGHILK